MSEAKTVHIAETLDKQLEACIHCGLCLEFCPTYRVTREEASSPRGRIYLMKALADGQIEASDPLFIEHELSCLVCRACETACPSGVEYSVLMEHTRQEIVKTGVRGSLHRFIYTTLLGDRTLTSLLQIPLAIASRTRIISLLKRTFDPLPKLFRHVAKLPDDIPFPSSRQSIYPRTTSKDRGSVGLLIGCIGDVFTASVNDATIAVLNALGHDVHIMPEITCCGALAAHAGYSDHARTLGETLCNAIETDKIEFFITNIAGCGAMMKDYGSLDVGSATTVRPKIKDISEFLLENHLDDLRSLGMSFEKKTRIAYQAPCHLYHGQRITDTPIRLLETIGNCDVFPLAENDICCGSAGTYNIERPNMATDLLGRKIELIHIENPDIVATANAGCLLQLRSGFTDRSDTPKVVHFIELIASLIP